MRIRFSLSLVALLAWTPVALAQSSRAFSEIATESFDAWDADDDGTLSPSEIDALVVEPKFKGEYAAALAAMKLVVRSTKVTPPTLTLDFVQNRSREPAGEVLPSEQPEAPEVRPARSARPPASLDRRYQSALRKIRSAKSELFADGTPDLDRCRQGPLGSCFFIAGVGAFVHRDSDAVKRMIREQVSESGEVSYTVTFGDGRAVTIPGLTDAQFGLTSSAGSDGRWLTVLEQAYGSLRMSTRPESRRTREASDALARGGSLGTTLRVLTGHVIDRMRLRANAEKDTQLVDKVKASLTEAFEHDRLAGASTGSATPLPPGINGKHAYAVLGLEGENVVLWNPHGNSFRPRGEPGCERGYETKGGVFRMPIADFVVTFDSLVVETAKPATSDEGRG